MDRTVGIEGRLAEAVARAAGEEPWLRDVAAELWRAPTVEDGPDLPAAERAGVAAADGGMGPGELAHRLLHLGRSLEALAAAEESRGPSFAAKLRVAIDRAVARGVEAHRRARRDRRDAWLAFLSHELKNPLNTVLNALWLLREQRDSLAAGRFLELAERAVRRMETQIQQLRDLEHKVAAPPPTREGRPPPEPRG